MNKKIPQKKSSKQKKRHILEDTELGKVTGGGIDGSWESDPKLENIHVPQNYSGASEPVTGDFGYKLGQNYGYYYGNTSSNNNVKLPKDFSPGQNSYGPDDNCL
jgi:hypothetical protein